MKKFLSMLLASVLLAGVLVGCTEKKEGDTTAPTDTTAPAEKKDDAAAPAGDTAKPAEGTQAPAGGTEAPAGETKTGG
ncbi:MAG: hypothetical protein KIS66_12700 [Fimbriimonadaceae bacterium]|nr:hypothetical protein [Fimbriimonadaceae bacterium]